MKSSENVHSDYEGYFIDNTDYNGTGIFGKLKNSLKIIYSFEAKAKIRRIINDTRPDLAHLHIFQHQLSPSILAEIMRSEIPSVNTVHDFKPLCPNYKMQNHGRLCEKCKGHRYYNCLFGRCFKDSLAASLVITLEMYLHHLLGSYGYIDTYITPSRFFRSKFIEFGFSPDRIVHIPNFIDCSAFRGDGSYGDYFIYFGRLSEEKGLKTLIKAMKSIKNSTLLIAGDGPLKQELIEALRINDIDNVRLLGQIKGSELAGLLENCKFSVVPSEWYENCPMSILESMAFGKPVIGSNIGGIPELIDQGRTGLLFEPGNSEELALHITHLLDNPLQTCQMGREARQIIEKEYSPEIHFRKTLGIYNNLFEKYGRPIWKV